MAACAIGVGVVQGSLENPPLVLCSSIKRLVLNSLSFIAVCSFAVFKHHNTSVYMAPLFTAFCCLWLLFLWWRWQNPARLELSPEGLVWFTGLRTRRYAWTDFSHFEVYRPSRGRPLVGLTWSPSSPHRSRLSGVLETVSGIDGSLGGSWGMDVEEAVAYLNDAMKRWGPDLRQG